MYVGVMTLEKLTLGRADVPGNMVILGVRQGSFEKAEKSFPVDLKKSKSVKVSK
jgi:hypothetical protein